MAREYNRKKQTQQEELFRQGLRRCSVCKEIKPLIDFGKEKRTKLGYKSLCKKCNNKKNHEYQHSSHEWKAYLSKYMIEYYRKRCVQFPDVIPTSGTKRKDWKKRIKPFKVRHKWTDDELNILRSLYPTGGIKLILKNINRSDGAIRKMVQKKGLKRAR